MWSTEAEAAWRQNILDFYRDNADEELYCVPSLSSGAWLPAPLIEARMTEDVPVLRLELPGNYMQRSTLEQAMLMTDFIKQLADQVAALDLKLQYALGFDFGRVSDLSTLSLLAIEQALKRRECLSIEMRNVPGKEQKMVVDAVMSHLRGRLIGAAFDATGMGWTVAEDAGRKYGFREDPQGAGVVMALKFTEEWYRLEMPPLKAAFEDNSLALTVDGIIGRATLSTLQRRLDAPKAAAKPAAVGAAGVAASTDIGTAYVDALGASGAGWIALGLVGLWGANTAWRYRDVIAAKIARPIPRLATFLRSF